MPRPIRPTPESPVVALDLDGTMGDYHRHFEAFARMWSGRDIVWNPAINGSFAAQLGMSKATYRQCKLAYRMGGMKRSMPVFENASELTRAIRRMGVRTIACTTRPYLHMSTIDLDTQHWMRRHGLQIDYILYGEHKYRDLVKSVGLDRIICAMDDDLSQIRIANRLGVPTIMRLNDANRAYEPDADQLFVSGLQEAEDTIICLINKHKSGS